MINANKHIIIPLLLLCGCASHFENKGQFTTQQSPDTSTSIVKVVNLDAVDYSSFCFVETSDVIIKVSYYNYWFKIINHSQELSDTLKSYIVNHIDSLDISKKYARHYLVGLLKEGKAIVYDKRKNNYVNSILFEDYYDPGDWETCPHWGKAFYFMDGKLFYRFEIVY